MHLLQNILHLNPGKKICVTISCALQHHLGAFSIYTLNVFLLKNSNDSCSGACMQYFMVFFMVSIIILKS